MADAPVRAELPVVGPDGHSVGLAGPGAGPAPRPRHAPREALAGGGDGVQGQDVAERPDVRVADKGKGALREET